MEVTQKLEHGPCSISASNIITMSDRKEFFSKYKELFQYDDYSSTDENVLLKSYLLRADAESALNSVPLPLQLRIGNTSPPHDGPASFGTSTLNDEDRLLQTTTGGITPRSPRSQQLEALELTQRELSMEDKLFHHNILFSPLRNSSNNNDNSNSTNTEDAAAAAAADNSEGRTTGRDSQDDRTSMLNSSRSGLSFSLRKKAELFGPDDLLGRAVDRANRPSPYKSPRQRLAQLTLARNDIGRRYAGPKTPGAPNYTQLNIEQRRPQQPQQPVSSYMYERSDDDATKMEMDVNNLEYTGISLKSTVSTPNSSVLPSARTISTIDSNAPALDHAPLQDGNTKTGMAAPFYNYGQGENKRRTRTKEHNNNNNNDRNTHRLPPPRKQRNHANVGMYDGGGIPHPLGNVSPRNPTGILPPPGDQHANLEQSSAIGIGGGSERRGRRHQFPPKEGGIYSTAAGYAGKSIARPGRAYVPQPVGSSADMNHVLFSNMSRGAGGSFNPDIAPKKRLEIPFDTVEERNAMLQKLNKMLQKTTGRPFTGYVDDIPASVLRRLKSLFVMEARRNKLRGVLDQDKVQYQKERQRRARQEMGFGSNFGGFKVL